MGADAHVASGTHLVQGQANSSFRCPGIPVANRPETVCHENCATKDLVPDDRRLALHAAKARLDCQAEAVFRTKQ